MHLYPISIIYVIPDKNFKSMSWTFFRLGKKWYGASKWVPDPAFIYKCDLKYP